MPTRFSKLYRGASSALPMVMIIVILLLVVLGVWMWIDMNRHDMAGKALEYERMKRGGVPSQASTVTSETTVVAPASVGGFECRRAAGPINIDGSGDDAAWRSAQVIENFSLPWLGEGARPAKTRTVARLLWDDQFLYFLAEMDDADVYADVGDHNGMLWHNDVFELFFKPSAHNYAYYEFQVNAKNTTLELFFPSRGSGGYGRWKNKTQFHLEAKVALRPGSTLNDASNRDTGWVVEGKIPWSDFAQTGGKPSPGADWKFALCRYDYSKEFEEPELSTCAPLKQSSFHRYEDYADIKFMP